MLGGRAGEVVELECPHCGAVVKTSVAEAEKGKVRCPNGHELAVMGMLGQPLVGGGGGEGDGKRR